MKNLKRVFTLVLTMVLLVGVLPMEALALVPGVEPKPTPSQYNTSGGSGWNTTGWWVGIREMPMSSSNKSDPAWSTDTLVEFFCNYDGANWSDPAYFANNGMWILPKEQWGTYLSWEPLFLTTTTYAEASYTGTNKRAGLSVGYKSSGNFMQVAQDGLRTYLSKMMAAMEGQNPKLVLPSPAGTYFAEFSAADYMPGAELNAEVATKIIAEMCQLPYTTEGLSSKTDTASYVKRPITNYNNFMESGAPTGGWGKFEGCKRYQQIIKQSFLAYCVALTYQEGWSAKVFNNMCKQLQAKECTPYVLVTMPCCRMISVNYVWMTALTASKLCGADSGTNTAQYKSATDTLVDPHGRGYAQFAWTHGGAPAACLSAVSVDSMQALLQQINPGGTFTVSSGTNGGKCGGSVNGWSIPRGFGYYFTVDSLLAPPYPVQVVQTIPGSASVGSVTSTPEELVTYFQLNAEMERTIPDMTAGEEVSLTLGLKPALNFYPTTTLNTKTGRKIFAGQDAPDGYKVRTLYDDILAVSELSKYNEQIAAARTHYKDALAAGAPASQLYNPDNLVQDYHYTPGDFKMELFVGLWQDVPVSTSDADFLKTYTRGYTGDGSKHSASWVFGDGDGSADQQVLYCYGQDAKGGPIEGLMRKSPRTADAAAAAALAAGLSRQASDMGFSCTAKGKSVVLSLDDPNKFISYMDAHPGAQLTPPTGVPVTITAKADESGELTEWFGVGLSIRWNNFPQVSIIKNEYSVTTWSEIVTTDCMQNPDGTIVPGSEKTTVVREESAPISKPLTFKGVTGTVVRNFTTLVGVNDYKYDFAPVTVVDQDNPVFHSIVDPNPHVEFNQGTIERDHVGPTGDFNSMTGTPTTTFTGNNPSLDGWGEQDARDVGRYYQYFAAGGSEFVVEFDGIYHHNETATRRFEWEVAYNSSVCTKTTEHGDCPDLNTPHQDCPGHPDGEGGTYTDGCHNGDTAHSCGRCGNPWSIQHPHSFGSLATVGVDVKYTGLDYVEITNLKVWQLSEAQLDGTRQLLETDKVTATLQSNAPAISYNIAGENTAAAGRMVYAFEPTSKDLVHHALSGTVGNDCDKVADDIKKLIEEDAKKICLDAWCVSDYIVLHTTAGDQSIMYFEKQVKAPTTMLDITVSATNPSCGSFASNTPSASITVNTPDMEFEKTTNEQLWKNNPMTSEGAKYDPAGVTVGGYNGDYNSRETKYTSLTLNAQNITWSSTQAGQNKSGVFGKRGYNKGEYSQAANFKPSKSLRIMADGLVIPDTKRNGRYDFTTSSVFYKNLVNYTAAGKNYQTNYPVAKQPGYTGKGFMMPAGYGSSSYPTVCNGVVVYNPISCEDAVIVPLTAERDQRIDLGAGSSTPVTLCPGDESCPYMTTDSCSYTGNHLHTEACYSVATYQVHTGFNAHEHTDACQVAKMQWYHNSSGCSYRYEYHDTTTTDRCSTCGHSCGYLVTTGGSYTTPPGAISSGSPSVATPYCWCQTNSSCGSYQMYAYTASATSTSGLCHAGNGWVRKPEYDFSKYACNNLPLNVHKCVVTTTATIDGSNEKTYTGSGSITLQPGSYNISLGGGKGGGSNGGNGGTVTGTLNITTTTTISYGNDGGGAGYDGNGGNAAWVAVGSYSHLSAVPTDKLIAVAGGGGAGNGGGGQGGGPNMAGTNGASQCGGYGEGGQLNRGGVGGHDARSGGYGYGGDGNCTYGCSDNEENGGGGGYYGGGGGGHDCTRYNDFDDGDGGGGSGYASSTYLSGIGGSTGANSSSSYVKFTGGTTTKDAGCYKTSTVIMSCTDPHHAWDTNWKFYTYGLVHADGKVCSGTTCTNSSDIRMFGNKLYSIDALRSGVIVKHANGLRHLSVRDSDKCTTCGATYLEVVANATGSTRVLSASEIAAETGHYPYGDSRCWTACNDASKHAFVDSYIDASGNEVAAGDFVNLDYSFEIRFPNTGDFYGTGRRASGECSPERGMGYTDGMDTTEWARYKWVSFAFDVVYEGNTYMAGDRVYLPVYKTFFEFYVPLENTEAANTPIRFGITAINDATPTTTEAVHPNAHNIAVVGNMSHLHDAAKNFYVDVVGRIGALTMNDVGDFRYSNFFKYTTSGWLVPNVLRRVDTSKQSNILSDPYDIRGILLPQAYFTSTTLDGHVYHKDPVSVNTNTYGSFLAPRSAVGVYRFPLQPSYLQSAVVRPLENQSNQKSLATQPMRVGYNAYLDFMTLGNYYGTDAQQSNPKAGDWVSVKPHYFRMDIQTGELTPADVYMYRDGKPYKINDADADIRYSNNDSTDMLISMNWTEECGRRNYYGSELRNTDAIYQQLGIGKPRGSSWIYGNYDVQLLTGRNRTCIGLPETYGIDTDPGDKLLSSRYWLQGARWHTSVGLPSSAVFVKSGAQCTTENIKDFYTKNGKTDQYVIAVSLEIYAYGQVWNLVYDGKNINSQGVQVTPTTPKVTPHLPGEPTPPKYPGNPGKEMPLVSIISINHSSKEDINQAGTH